jgi:hypothetical protein
VWRHRQRSSLAADCLHAPSTRQSQDEQTGRMYGWFNGRRAGTASTANGLFHVHDFYLSTNRGSNLASAAPTAHPQRTHRASTVHPPNTLAPVTETAQAVRRVWRTPRPLRPALPALARRPFPLCFPPRLCSPFPSLVSLVSPSRSTAPTSLTPGRRSESRPSLLLPREDQSRDFTCHCKSMDCYDCEGYDISLHVVQSTVTDLE